MLSRCWVISSTSRRVTRVAPVAVRMRLEPAGRVARQFYNEPPHDVGGDPLLAESPVPPDSPLQPWELEAHSLMVSLAKRQVFSTDEFRRVIEALPANEQAEWSYYEKWSAATATLLQEKGLLTAAELQTEVFGESSPSQASPPPLFAPGDAVTVRSEQVTRTGWRRPHLRTPGYVHGVSGHIERHCGCFDDPSLLAYGLKGPPQHLYRVRFTRSDLWPGAEAPADTIDVDVYESWLEAAAKKASSPGKPQPQPLPAAFRDRRDDDRGAGTHDREHHSPSEDQPQSSTHEHSHDHSGTQQASEWAGQPDTDAHAVEHGHVHLDREEIERSAVAAEGPPRPGSVVHEALVRLLERRGYVSRAELHQIGEGLEMAGRSLPAARLVARAWVDEDFKARLLSNATEAALELGIDARNPNAPTQLTVVPNDERTHNLIVCTLCSCYPAAVLGPSPTWYKSRSYRARAVREPRRLLREAFGLALPEDTQVRVHDSTADLRYFVLPMRPPGTDGWDEEALRRLISRNALVGVALPERPTNG